MRDYFVSNTLKYVPILLHKNMYAMGPKKKKGELPFFSKKYLFIHQYRVCLL